jgi:aryl-alcohol dehydrogenase-like predicted oxidoreductase
MQAGLLTGAFSPERVANLHQDDWRKRDPQFQGENLERNLALAEKLRQIGEKRDVGPGPVAIAWALAWPGVTGAIVGGRSPRQVDGWLPAASLELTQAELDEVSDAIESTEAGFGPSRPPR